MFDLSNDIRKLLIHLELEVSEWWIWKNHEVSDYFPEFFALKGDCKFNNCLHKEEPNCAVKQALDNDEIAWSRYNSYLKILEGDDEHYRNDIHDAERKASDETRKS